MDSLVHYVRCVPLRLIAGVFDETSAPHDGVDEFYGIGPATNCANAAGVICRGVIACSASPTVRAQ